MQKQIIFNNLNNSLILKRMKLRNQIRENQKQILIVDDEPYNQMAVKNIIEILGIKDVNNVVQTAINGQVALDIIKNEILLKNGCRIDLIFMDQNMPVMDGCEATANLRNCV